MSKVSKLIAELKSNADPERAKGAARYFKTGKGEYGEGDKFIGVAVPLQRSIAKKYIELELKDIQKLLSSRIHEHRLTGVFVLVIKYSKSTVNKKQEIVNFYMKNTRNINNWDMVDSSASYILGDFLINKPREILFKLAVSSDVWERRIAIISTGAFIKDEDFDTTLSLSEILLNDNHDLIHKAVGWMLREIGNRNMKVLEEFLNGQCTRMPRTMLRYAIEKMPEEKRKRYLKKKV